MEKKKKLAAQKQAKTLPIIPHIWSYRVSLAVNGLSIGCFTAGTFIQLSLLPDFIFFALSMNVSTGVGSPIKSFLSPSLTDSLIPIASPSSYFLFFFPTACMIPPDHHLIMAVHAKRGQSRHHAFPVTQTLVAHPEQCDKNRFPHSKHVIRRAPYVKLSYDFFK